MLHPSPLMCIFRFNTNLSSFSFQNRYVHKPRRSCFQDPTMRKALIRENVVFEFNMVTGFLIEPMHLVDGGVIKDVLEHIFKKRILRSDGDHKIEKQKRAERWIGVFNQSLILELVKFRYT